MNLVDLTIETFTYRDEMSYVIGTGTLEKITRNCNYLESVYADYADGRDGDLGEFGKELLLRITQYGLLICSILLYKEDNCKCWRVSIMLAVTDATCRFIATYVNEPRQLLDFLGKQVVTLYNALG